MILASEINLLKIQIFGDGRIMYCNYKILCLIYKIVKRQLQHLGRKKEKVCLSKKDTFNFCRPMNMKIDG